MPHHFIFMTRFARWTTGALCGLFAYALLEPHRLVVRRFNVEMAHLPDATDGLRIVQLSDFHRSALTSGHVVRRAVDLANAQKPDVIVLTGDFLSRLDSYSSFLFASHWAQSPQFYAAEIAHILKDLRAPEGVWAVHGNHDAAAGSFAVLDELLERCGVRVLNNSSTRIREMPLIGLDDLRVGHIDLPQACAEIEDFEAQIILSHNPRVLPLFKERNALVLAGHTHSGQVHLPFSRFRRRPFDMRDSPWNEGWYQDEKARMYVNAGVGSVHLPVRFLCPPEITVFTLKQQNHQESCEHQHHEHH